ncbi:hypothetical protein PN441_15930 [Spirulina major CS-329]|nr:MULTISPECIES: hypothetical protein [Spirulina]MDB9493901.1 hypothetical protein [Spirulina subsalsa CS-330]MDB9504567.1 hypothetical protein [Spirulina major CS-329]
MAMGFARSGWLKCACWAVGDRTPFILSLLRSPCRIPRPQPGSS